jgi:hypothetical protein
MNWLTPALTRFLLALFVLALFGGAVIVMSFFVVPDQNREVVIQLVGGVNTLAGLVVGYYFGSSAKRDGEADPVKVVNSPSQPVPTTDLPRPRLSVDDPEGAS